MKSCTLYTPLGPTNFVEDYTGTNGLSYETLAAVLVGNFFIPTTVLGSDLKLDLG